MQAFVNAHEWIWSVLQMIHYVGMSLIIGIIGTLDLRILGLFKSIPIAALRPLVPWAVAGFFGNLLTGIMFVTGKDSGPTYYTDNLSFQLKMLFLLLVFVNLLIFTLTDLETRTYATPADGNAPTAAKAVAAFSLVAWIMVIFFGRTMQYNDTLLLFLGL
jgi:H+/Cl- antiporter ClcA